ncbi:MAG: DUF58 domain-containing protein [Lachnospiraceae bacterium]|nr:DUF58 domain-containing protein [Lachnospiraceae bacterium]
MINRIIFFSLGILGLCVLALWTGELYFFGIVGILICILLVNLLLMLIQRKLVKCKVEVKSSTIESNVMKIRIEVDNPTFFPVFQGRGKVEIRNLSFDITNKHDIRFSIPNKRTQILEYEIESEYCGKFEININSIKLYDSLGIFSWVGNKNLKYQAYLFPDYYYVNSVSQVMRVNYEKEHQFSHERNSNLSDLLQYREYQKGDSIKHINWKLSNRYDEYIIREFDTPIDNQILVVSDAYPINKRTKNIAYSVLMSVCMSFIEKGISHQIVYIEHGRNNMIPKELIRYEQVIESMKDIMNSPNADNESLMQVLIKNGSIQKYSKVIYISNYISDIEKKRLATMGNIKIIHVAEGEFALENVEATICALNI